MALLSLMTLTSRNSVDGSGTVVASAPEFAAVEADLNCRNARPASRKLAARIDTAKRKMNTKSRSDLAATQARNAAIAKLT